MLLPPFLYSYVECECVSPFSHRIKSGGGVGGGGGTYIGGDFGHFRICFRRTKSFGGGGARGGGGGGGGAAKL